jgi:lysophospholipase L1-like esterase
MLSSRIMRGMQKKIVLRTVTGILLFLAVLEICARIDDALRWKAPIFSFYSVNSLFGYDDEGMPINIPGRCFEKWFNNKFGFRGPDISLAKPRNTIRIVCMGTSETYGTYESPEQEWPAQLGRLLKKSTPSEIINSAGPGLTFQYYQRYFEKYILALKPDVTILLVNPYFHAVRAIRSLRNNKSLNDGLNISAGQGRTPHPSLLSHFRILPKIKSLLRRFLPSRLQRIYHVYMFKKIIAKEEKIRLSSQAPLDAVPKFCMSSYREELERMIDFLIKNKISVILGSYPSLMSKENLNLYPDLFLGFRSTGVEFSFRGEMDIYEKYKEATLSLANQKKLIFVDIAEAVPKNLDYFSDNVHYTDAGAQLVAKAFLSAIIQLYNH